MKNGDYILVIAPENFPGKKYRGRYAYEHTVVYWQNHNKIPNSTQVIHHKNHNKHDNRIENLELITIKEHNKSHSEKPWSYVFATCLFCKNIFRVRGNLYRQRIKDNKGKIYCGRSCQIKQRHLDLKKN